MAIVDFVNKVVIKIMMVIDLRKLNLKKDYFFETP